MKNRREVENTSFHDDSEIYDVINDFDYDVKFWGKWCKKAGKSVLELCCGTGRIALPLIKGGLDYYGIDNSKPFLSTARKKTKLLEGKYKFKYDDIRNFNLKRKFNSIIISL